MGQLLRFGVSMDAELLAAFDRLIEKRQYTNRSEALRDLVRDSLVRTRWHHRGKTVMTAALCLVYDAAGPRTAATLSRFLSDHSRLILNRMQIPLDHDVWFDILALRGKSGELQAFADKVGAVRGVHSAQVFPAVSD